MICVFGCVQILHQMFSNSRWSNFTKFGEKTVGGVRCGTKSEKISDILHALLRNEGGRESLSNVGQNRTFWFTVKLRKEYGEICQGKVQAFTVAAVVWRRSGENGRFAFLSPPLGDLGATYGDHLRLVGKRVGDFLLVLIETLSTTANLKAFRHTCIFCPTV